MNTNKLAEYTLIILSIFIIWIPSVSMVLNIGPSAPLTEKRNLAKFPKLEANWDSISKFPTSFKNYFADNYGFRSILIKSYNIIMTKYIKNIARDRVLFGKENWLFWTGENALNQYHAFVPLKQDDLIQYRQILEEREAYCRKKGIRYLLIIPPDKHSIYPEYLPDWMKKASDESYLDQFITCIKKSSAIEFIDLREPLLKGKEKFEKLNKNYLIYYKTDTHWNDIGAFIGYQTIMEKIKAWFPNVQNFTLSDFTLQSITTQGGDLASYAGISDQYSIENIQLVPKKERRAQMVALDSFYEKNYPTKLNNKSNPIQEVGIFAMETKTPTLPKAVMFRDSYSNSLIPFISEQFNRIVYFWYIAKTDPYDFDTKIIEHEKPDIVITEIAERVILNIKKNPAEVKQK